MKITSYNSQGFGSDKTIFTASLLMNCDILLLQEHWLHSENFDDFSRLGNVNYHACTPMDSGSGVHYGRPFGGCAIIWNDCANLDFTAISCTNARICAGIIKLSQSQETILMINVYLPCDEGYRGPNYRILVDTLDNINTLIMDSRAGSIIIGGDFNCDFRRLTPHVQTVSEFMLHNNLKCGLDHILSSVDYTFESKSTHIRSCIDHFAFSNDLFHTMETMSTIDDENNFSDHRAIYCQLDINVNYCQRPEVLLQNRPNWRKASPTDIDNYSKQLEILLRDIHVPEEALYCKNSVCDIHTSHICNFYTAIADACLKAMDITIPKCTGSKKKLLPGWNKYVKSKRHDAQFWHNIWKANGSPRNGLIADIMRQTRKDYHYSIRYCKKHEQQIKAINLSEAAENKNGKQFWDLLKQGSGSKSSAASLVDGLNNPEDICDLFYTKFQDLYTSVAFDTDKMAELKNDISEKVKKQAEQETYYDINITVSANDVCKMLHKLKHYKSDGNKGIISDCLIHGPKILPVLLCMLFNMIIIHGVVPNDFSMGTMVPIPKNKSMGHISDKYRAITLSSSFGKLFDMLIIEYEGGGSLKTDCLQFGFKSDSSTVLCTSVLRETVCHFVQGGCNVYGLFLDASKAFDRVDYVKLFNLLIAKGMDIKLVRCLLQMYTNQTLRVKWNNVISEEFNALNGVKQGGVLSPLLFNIYMDELIHRLRKSGVGCHVGPYYCSAFGYADDICIIANCIKDLSYMIKECEKFANEYRVMFNGAKPNL